MSLQIGFSNKFYTLWNVSSDIKYTVVEGGYLPYQVVNYMFIQNLSFDEEKAIYKAKSMGCIDLIINTDLYGRNSSFDFKTKLYSELPISTNPFFLRGKLINTPILECIDFEILENYYNNYKNRYAKSILLNNGYIDIDGEIIEKTIYNNMIEYNNTLKILKETSQIEVYVERNLQTLDGDALGYFKFMDKIFPFIFKESKEMHYNDFSYRLPTIKGKGKIIKNKTLTLDITPLETPHGLMFNVNNFTIKKVC